MFRVFLGLGSNIGDRRSFLMNAVEEIRKFATVLRSSSIYETEPWRMSDTKSFYNMALEIETTLHPGVLLTKLKAIEKKLGRSAQSHMKPREIDIDILLYGGPTIQNDNISVPHPELHLRRFVLEPLCEIDSTLIHPSFGKPIKILLDDCPDTSTVVKLKNISSEVNTKMVQV